MPTMDIFNSSAFTSILLTNALESIPTLPQALGNLNLFEPRPIRTRAAMIESRDNVLSLIQTSERGAPKAQGKSIKRSVRYFETRQLAKADTLQASEIQNIRAFGSETELMAVAREVSDRMARLSRDMDLTHEFHRLGAVQGVVLDADSSVLHNWFTEFGVSQPGEIDFDLDNAAPASGALLKKCDEVVTAMRRAAKGAWIPGTRCVGLCGTDFWRDLMAHPEIVKVREMQAVLGDGAGLATILGLDKLEVIQYGGIQFVRYWGTDDDTTVAVSASLCKFFPIGAPGVFQVAYSPLETFEFVNTAGLPRYAMMVPDTERQMSVEIELYSFPLYYCTRPLMLQRAKRT